MLLSWPIPEDWPRSLLRFHVSGAIIAQSLITYRGDGRPGTYSSPVKGYGSHLSEDKRGETQVDVQIDGLGKTCMS